MFFIRAFSQVMHTFVSLISGAIGNVNTRIGKFNIFTRAVIYLLFSQDLPKIEILYGCLDSQERIQSSVVFILVVVIL